ncbi:MAG: hypothetical protein IKS19_07830 [Clostridia bacterium]|nr:hypothetical protein [Clostridia bacterium]
MSGFFIELFNMSVSAVWLILAVFVVRLIVSRASKNLRLVLWALVAFRLAVPFSLESITSLIPSAQTIPHDIIYAAEPQIHSGVPFLNSYVNPIISDTFAPIPESSANPMQIVVSVAWNIWLVGLAVLLVYGTVSYILLRRKVRASLLLCDNMYICDNIESPFILGIIRPGIYLPSSVNDEQARYISLHERAHLKRLDHIWMIVGFAVLCAHWFNPFVWLGFILFSRDIELACDERVVREMDFDGKKAYAETLLMFSAQRRLPNMSPLAFGEVGVKQRIRSALSFKKPAVWVIIAAAACCVVLAMCFLTNPVTAKSEAPESPFISLLNAFINRLNGEPDLSSDLLKKLDVETDSISCYAHYNSVYYNNEKISLGKYLDEDKGQDLLQVFAVKDDDIYFAFEEGHDENRTWNIAKCSIAGDNMQVLCSEGFSDRLDPDDHINYWIYHGRDYRDRYGYYLDGKIVLSDHKKVLEYSVRDNTGRVYDYGSYVFPELKVKSEIIDNETIRFSTPDGEKTLRLSEAAKSSKALSEIYKLKDEKLWNGESRLCEFFSEVETLDDDIYILCPVFKYSGSSNTVILKYDPESNSCRYAGYYPLDDRYCYSFSLVSVD